MELSYERMNPEFLKAYEWLIVSCAPALSPSATGNHWLHLTCEYSRVWVLVAVLAEHIFLQRSSFYRPFFWCRCYCIAWFVVSEEASLIPPAGQLLRTLSICLCYWWYSVSITVHGQGEGKVAWFVKNNMGPGTRMKSKRKGLRIQLSFTRILIEFWLKTIILKYTIIEYF